MLEPSKGKEETRTRGQLAAASVAKFPVGPPADQNGENSIAWRLDTIALHVGRVMASHGAASGADDKPSHH